MIDFHTHSLFSDGELVPSELLRRAEIQGCRALAITDHGDSSNLEIIIPNIVKACEALRGEWQIEAIPGIELTHVPPRLIAELVRRARALGARVVVVHGETVVEPVCRGTNRAALESDIDILAHPGFITEEEAVLARERGILLEISGRKGHCYTNGYVAAMARRVGGGLIVNSDAHAPGDLLTPQFAEKVALGAGLTADEYDQVRRNAEALLEKVR